MKAHFRRSALYVPGDSEKMLQKSANSPADILLLNLEDGVATSQKNSARKKVADALKSVDFGDHEVVVRVNPIDSDIGVDDVAEIIPCRPDGICLPKVEKTAEIQTADRLIRELEIYHGLPGGGTKLHAMIESAAGLLHSANIAAASPRMASLIFGSADYANDLHCRPGEDRQELLLALQMLVISARAAGIDALDAPCFDIRNRDLLNREAIQARRIGFTGKSALHPDQIAIINQIFDATPEEIEWAKRTIAELDEAERRGKALSTMDGVLVDNPHRAAAERILNRAKQR
jgi:citrate lyase beta subunit